MNYILQMGVLYRMSPMRYRAYLRDLAAGKDHVNPEHYGVYVGLPIDVTDLTAEEAAIMLKEALKK